MGKPFKVFGIGLNRTGTTSLKKALRILGYKHQKRQGRYLNWLRQGRVTQIFDDIKEMESFEDWPWPLMYKELLAHYGEGARFILTRRTSADVWIKSLKQHSLRTHPVKHQRRLALGYDYPHGYEAEHAAFYEAHYKDVHAHFAALKKSQLLLEVCWEEGDGWKQLCGFLGEKRKFRPFPHANAMAAAREEPKIREENEHLIAAQVAERKRAETSSA